MKTEVTVESNIIELVGLKSMLGKRVRITVEPVKKERSNPQNRYRWKVVVPMVRRELQQQGVALASEQVNEVLKKVTGFYHRIVDVSGQRVDVFEPTKKGGTQQFELWMDAVRAWGAMFLNIQIPLPNEHQYDEWVEQQIEKESVK